MGSHEKTFYLFYCGKITQSDNGKKCCHVFSKKKLSALNDTSNFSFNSFPENFFVETADYIANTQSSDGSIPWFKDGPTDPWDHIEALMGLTIGGNHDQARKGFDWLKKTNKKMAAGWRHIGTEKLRMGQERKQTTLHTSLPAYGISTSSPVIDPF